MNYSSIRSMDISNGEGIRVSLFVSGCKFNCKGCFNQESQCYTYGKPYTENVKKAILDHIGRPHIAGLSLLGGDPLWQNESGLLQLVILCKKTHLLGKTVWIWSGFTWEEIFPNFSTSDVNILHIYRQELIRNCDVWVDGKFDLANSDLNLQWKGSSNQRAIDVKQSLLEEQIVLYEGMV